MDRQERLALIERYKDGYQEVVEAMAGITETALDARPASEDWTAREVVHHLADNEMISAIRLRRLLVEDSPRIEAYDEPEYARRLHYDRPIATSLESFWASRRSSASLLDLLAEPDWVRAGTHSQSGRYSVEDWLAIYVTHAHDHAAQIRRARQVAG